MNEVVMIPPEEMQVLMNKHSQIITRDQNLTKAARLSAVQDKILHSKLPAGIQKSKLKSLAPRVAATIKKYKKGPLTSGIVDASKEEQTRAFEELLKSILRKPNSKGITPASRKKKRKQGELRKLLPTRGWIPYQTRSRSRHV